MKNNSQFSRRNVLALAASGLVAPHFSTSAKAATSPVLIELFTSQGCSSCPPADKIAGELSTNPNYLVVSMNVDYWDYIGWKDTLAKPAFTTRQMDYAHARGDMNVYTPQMIINGSAHVVGSNQAAIEKTIAEAKNSNIQALNFSVKGTKIEFDISAVKTTNLALWIMTVRPSVKVKIERGENSGKTITYHNVVEKLSLAKTITNGETKFAIEMPSTGQDHILAVLQKGPVGQVVGCARIA
jgi:hypothetical protein